VALDRHLCFEPVLTSRKSRLLKPGWAGELSPDEFAYIKTELQQSSSLRRRWGFRPTAKRLSESRIREIAREGLQAIGRPVLASAVGKHGGWPTIFHWERISFLIDSYKISPVKPLKTHSK
jgi:hypothetical protein